MERPFSTSKVTVEYFDPHDVYKLIAPGLVPRLPLRNLHWQSHAGPLRSIDTLHVELVPAGGELPPSTSPNVSPALRRSVSASVKDDGFQTQQIGGKSASTDTADTPTAAVRQPGTQRRHQIPGLRRTPYLKVLLVRCDDSDTYKSQTRAEIREWIKEHTPPSQSARKANTQENHDALEWLVVHVVIPNTFAANQPRASGKSDAPEKSRTSRWGSGSSTLLEKLRSDFNGSSKSSPDRIAQIRIGINDVPYDILPRVVPATPTGYSESRQDAENAWEDLIGKFKELILSSFDMRVSQYEEDIKEKDSQRVLPGWNFCTFFILKEGLARGFESVGLVEDALVGYDELSVGLDTVIQEQATSGDPERHGGALLGHTEDLVNRAEAAVQALGSEEGDGDLEDDQPVDLQATDAPKNDKFDEIPISSTKKPYREMIVANNVSVFDFRCYIFARQISLLLRLGNAWSTREELLAKLKEQQESVLHGVAPRAPPPKQTEEAENLSMLAEICRRTLEFVPAVSQVMRTDILAALKEKYSEGDSPVLSPALAEAIDNLVASFAFSVAQQVLAQTSTKALPIPPSTLTPSDAHEPKSSIPELKTMMHPARNSSLVVRTNTRQPPSPGIFPGPRRPSAEDAVAPNSQFLKAGLEELAARRAELYALSRNVLQGGGKKRGWDSGWTKAPVLGDSEGNDFEDVNLDGDDENQETKSDALAPACIGLVGIENGLLHAALDNRDDFYRLYETLTDKALRHYTVANHTHAVKTSMADLAVLKYHLGEFGPAASFFYMTTPFFGENSWSLLELSMLVMYSRCLRELQRKDEFVRVGLKLLTKAAAAENEKLHQKTSLSVGPRQEVSYPEKSAISGFLNELLSVAKTLSNEVRVPLSHLFTQVEVVGTPEYHDGKDCFSLTIKLRSLLVDELKVEKATLRLSSTTPGGTKEVRLHTSESSTLRPGNNQLRFTSTTNVSGHYRIDRTDIVCDNVDLHWEREVNQTPSKTANVFRVPDLQLYRPAGGLSCRLTPARDIQLDKNNSVDLEVSTGWNTITSCELSVKPATGGLRIISTEAEFLGPPFAYEKPPEASLFRFGAIPTSSSIKMRFPYTIEQDVANISVRVEVTYTTDDGTYHYSSIFSVPIALALGVNVQDVFKDKSLFSRFSVSTASSSPLRLFKSELLDSEVFAAHSAAAPNMSVMVFPKQPASLLYKITRKSADIITPKTQRTMYLKLDYSVLLDEIMSLVEEVLAEATKEPPLSTFSNLLIGRVLTEVQFGLSAYDLERAALLGEIPTTFISPLLSEKAFLGLGNVPGTKEDASVVLKAFLKEWQVAHPKLTIKEIEAASRTILIPVDVPSIPVFHSVDIQLPPPEEHGPGSTVAVNQLLSANLRLRWTRIWDTAISDGKSINKDYEFSYEVTGLPDTWLIGGRRRGHFRSLGVDKSDAKFGESELHVPVLLVPLREGRLPYPNVEIREVKEEGDDSAQGHGHHEIDYQNIGETVRVVSDLQKVTLSLDASGPSGGPLVLESERREFSDRILL